MRFNEKIHFHGFWKQTTKTFIKNIYVLLSVHGHFLTCGSPNSNSAHIQIAESPILKSCKNLLLNPIIGARRGYCYFHAIGTNYSTIKQFVSLDRYQFKALTTDANFIVVNMGRTTYVTISIFNVSAVNYCVAI